MNEKRRFSPGFFKYYYYLHYARNKMIGIVIAVIFITVVFQTQNTRIYQPTPTPTVNPQSVKSVLIRLEDLGWLSGMQVEVEDPLSPSSAIPYETVYTTFISPTTRSTGRFSSRTPGYGVGQEIWVYADTETALQAYEELMSTIFEIAPDNVDNYLANTWPNPSITNTLTICREGRATAEGTYETCQADMQYGRYIVSLNLHITGRATKLSDWKTILTIVQDRLVTFVEQES